MRKKSSTSAAIGAEPVTTYYTIKKVPKKCILLSRAHQGVRVPLKTRFDPTANETRSPSLDLPSSGYTQATQDRWVHMQKSAYVEEECSNASFGFNATPYFVVYPIKQPRNTNKYSRFQLGYVLI